MSSTHILDIKSLRQPTTPPPPLELPPQPTTNNDNNPDQNAVVSPDHSTNRDRADSRSSLDGSFHYGPALTVASMASKTILISSKLFLAILLLLFISTFLSITYITGLSRPNNADHIVNYIPTLQSGYSVTKVDTTTSTILSIQSARSISTIPPFHSLYPTTHPIDFFTLQLVTNHPKDEYKLTELTKQRLISAAQQNPDLFGFSGVISNDGLPVFTFLGGNDNYLFVLHCENLMCSESVMAAVDLNIFYPLKTAINTFEMMTGQPQTIPITSSFAPGNQSNPSTAPNQTGNTTPDTTQSYVTQSIKYRPYPFFVEPIPITLPQRSSSFHWVPSPEQHRQSTLYPASMKTTSSPKEPPLNDLILPGPKSIPFPNPPMNATTRLALSPTLKPIVAVVLDSGELLLASCGSITCQDSLTHITLIHPYVAKSIAININPYNIVLAFTPKFKPLPQVNGGPLQLAICQNQDCSDFFFRTVLGLYASLTSSISLAWQVDSGLTMVFPGYWLQTPIPGILIENVLDTPTSSIRDTIKRINPAQYELLTTVSMHPFMSVAFTKLAVEKSWLTKIRNDPNHLNDYAFSYNPFTPEFKIQIKAMLLQFYIINDTLGYNGDDFLFDFEKLNLMMEQQSTKMRTNADNRHSMNPMTFDNSDQGIFRQRRQRESLVNQQQQSDDEHFQNPPTFFQKQPIYGTRTGRTHDLLSQSRTKTSGQYYHTLQHSINIDSGLNNHNINNNNEEFIEQELHKQTQKHFEQFQKVKNLREFRAQIRENPSQYPSSLEGYIFDLDTDSKNQSKAKPDNQTAKEDPLHNNWPNKGTDDHIDLDNPQYPPNQSHHRFQQQQRPQQQTTTEDQNAASLFAFPNGDIFLQPADNSIILTTLTPAQFEEIVETIHYEIQLMISQYSGLPQAYYRTDRNDPTKMEPKTIYLTCQHQCKPGTVIVSMPLASHPVLTDVEDNNLNEQYQLQDEPDRVNEQQTTQPKEDQNQREGTKDTTNTTTIPEISNTKTSRDIPITPLFPSTPSATTHRSTHAPITYRPTEIEGRLRDVITLDGSSKMTVLLLHDQDPLETDPKTATDSADSTTGQTPSPQTYQSLSSFGCSRSTCQLTAKDVDDSFPDQIANNAAYNPTKIAHSEYYYSLFGGSIHSLTTIVSDLLDVTHMSVDSDPFFTSYQYLLFDLGGLPMYSRCFDQRCHTMHVQPLLSGAQEKFFNLGGLTRDDLMTVLNETSTDDATMTTTARKVNHNDMIQSTSTTTATTAPYSTQLQPTAPSFTCTSSPCFTIVISPIDSMVLILVGNENTSIIHCSNMFCLPYFTP